MRCLESRFPCSSFGEQKRGTAAARHSKTRPRSSMRGTRGTVLSPRPKDSPGLSSALVVNDKNGKINWRRFDFATGQLSKLSLSSIAEPGQPLPASLTESLNRLAAHYASISCPTAVNRAAGSEDDEILKFVHTTSTRRHSPTHLCEPFPDAQLAASLACLTDAAPGPDSISPLLLANIPSSFRACLLFLYNMSWSQGVMPACWKQADVCPIYKGNGAPANMPKSFRPISLTSCLVKVFERMIAVRLVQFLEENHFFSPWQAGFRKGFSTIDQLYRIIDRIQLAFRRHDHVSVAFLDIAAAFDTVWHAGLLYKLHAAGVCGKAWTWIKCFLSDRSFRVVSGRTTSQTFTLGAGVPQGSILGPLLFLIYVNDIPSTRSVEIALYADDLAAWPILDGLDGDHAMNTFLSLLSRWSGKWHMAFSMPKSGHLCFHNFRSSEPNPEALRLGDSIVPRVQKYRYLGTIFHESLTWKPQTNQVISRASHAAFRVASIPTQTGPPPRIIRQLVQSVVVPIITYGFPLWRPHSKAAWSKLESAVCLPLRCALGLPSSTQRLALFAEYGIIGPRLQHDRSALVLAHRAHIALAPAPQSGPRDYSKPRIVHSSHKLFALQSSFPLPRVIAKRCIPFAKAVKFVEHTWNVFHESATCKSSAALASTALSLQLHDLLSAPKRTRYSRFSLRPYPTCYIMLDNRPTATLRARIRLNRHHFRSRQHLLRLEDSADCATCKVPETAEHVLLTCPRFALHRFHCLAELSQRYTPEFSVSLITGDFRFVHKKILATVQTATARFLHEINSRRPI